MRNVDVSSGLKAGHCRLCGSKSVKIIIEGLKMATPVPYPLNGDMRLLNCALCGFVGAETKSVTRDYEHYYTHYNKHHSREGMLADLDRSYFEKIFAFIETGTARVFDGARVLDFGSGAKLLSEIAIKRGASVASNFDLKVSADGKLFDIIVSTHCFEHIFDFSTELARIHSMLSDDGVFCIAVPDIRGYSDYYYGPYNCFDLEHINHFDYKSLSEALRLNGFYPELVLESERLVTATLAYPEVVILAKKVKSNLLQEIHFQSNRKPIETVMESYMSRSAKDLTATLMKASEIFEANERDGVKAAYGIYGLSSYAFRILTRWDVTGIPLGWLADSDCRLAGKSILRKKIFDSEEFKKCVRSNMEHGIRTICFVVAVNAHRIETFLRGIGVESLDVFILPPDCQNRN